PAEYEDYRAQLRTLVAKGKSATLYVSERSQGSEARVIHDLLLELRPLLNDDRLVFGRQKRALRLYYGEPATLDNVLLGLHLATKEASSSGLREQDVSIGVAKERAHNWAQAQ